MRPAQGTGGLTLLLALGCASAPHPGAPRAAVAARDLRVVGQRRVQPTQPPRAAPSAEGQPEGEPIACYSLEDKHQAFGGPVAYALVGEQAAIADEHGGLLQRYVIAKPSGGACAAPQGLKTTRVDAVIVWTPVTCAHLLRGPLLAWWNAHGGPRSALGYPVTDELPVRQGGLHQYFEHGEVVQTPRGEIVAKRY